MPGGGGQPKPRRIDRLRADLTAYWTERLPDRLFVNAMVAQEIGRLLCRVHAKGMTYGEMARWLGISAPRVQQLVWKALYEPDWDRDWDQDWGTPRRKTPRPNVWERLDRMRGWEGLGPGSLKRFYRLIRTLNGDRP